MKIAHLIPHFFDGIGGLQVCVHNIARQHASSGNKVYVLHCGSKPDGFEAEYKLKQIPNFKMLTLTYPLSKWVIVAYIASLQKQYEFDVWQINGGYPYGAFLAQYFNKRKIPAILRCSGDDIQISKALNYGVRRNHRINHIITDNYKKYAGLVAITDTVKNEYLDIGVPENNISTIPNGIDFERISSSKQSTRIREELKLPFEAKIILTVGRNHPKKGYDLIPEILSKILEKGIDAYWIVVGKGALDVAKNETSNRIIPVEEILSSKGNNKIPSDRLISFYKCADLFAMPSMLETFGIVLLEAMAAGLPVVCFNVPGVRDVFSAECGAMRHPGDVNAFAEQCISILFSNSEELYRLPCQEYAKKYNWAIIAEKYHSLYKSLI